MGIEIVEKSQETTRIKQILNTHRSLFRFNGYGRGMDQNISIAVAMMARYVQ